MHTKRRILAGLLVLVIAGGGALEGCTSLPALGDRSVTTVALDTDGTRLGKGVQAAASDHPRKI